MPVMPSRIPLIVGMILIAQFLHAQIGVNTTSPHPNASMDIRGVNKGLLIPRGDNASRTALNSNNAKGLMMYDTISNTLWIHNGNGLASGWQSLAIGSNHWVLSGALGTEITNTNPDGFWSANASTVLIDPGVILSPVSGPGTRMMWLPQKSAFRLGTVHNNDWNADSIGTWSTGIGYSTKAKGQFSLALGLQTSASGITSTAMGYNTTARGENAISMGSVTSALGANTTSIGFKTYAGSYGSVAMGRYNDTIVNSTRTAWVSTDPLLILGNGTSDFDLHNAMVVYKNGSLVMKNPTTVLSDPGLLPLPASGPGTRMMWLPLKSAIRIGTVHNDAWDASNIGMWSTGIGFSTKASGPLSVAFGQQTTASGFSSTAIGQSTTASGESSIAMGFITSAMGSNSTSMGFKRMRGVMVALLWEDIMTPLSIQTGCYG